MAAVPARLALSVPAAALCGCSRVPPELARPNRVALGQHGEVYVSDFHHDRIVVFDADGAFRGTFGSQGIGKNQLWRVTAMTVAPDGALIVANRRPASDARASDIDFELIAFVDGEEVDRVTLDGGTLQPDGWIDGVAALGADAWIVADATHGELVEVDREGRRRGTYGGVPRLDAAPSAVGWDGDALLVVEQHRHRVSRVPRGGAVVELPLGDGPDEAPRFPSAVGACTPTDGGPAWIAVADFGRHMVERFAMPGGARLDAFAPTPVGPDQPVQLMDLAVAPDCSKLYLVDSKGDRMLITRPTGEVLADVRSW